MNVPANRLTVMQTFDLAAIHQMLSSVGQRKKLVQFMNILTFEKDYKRDRILCPRGNPGMSIIRYSMHSY